MKYLLLTLISLSFVSFSQEEPSREYAPGVWELTTVDVDWGNMGDYMDGLEQTWVPAAEIQKEMGIITDYAVWTSNNSVAYLALYYPSHANMDPWTEEQQAEFAQKLEEYREAKGFDAEDYEKISSSYKELRDIRSVELTYQINFN